MATNRAGSGRPGRAEKQSHGGRQLVHDTVAAAFDAALDDGSTPFSKMVALVQTASGWPDHPGSALFGVGSFVKLSIGCVHWIVQWSVGWLITILALWHLGLPLPLARVLGRLLARRLLAGLNPLGGYADRMRLLGAWWAVATQDPDSLRFIRDLVQEHVLAGIERSISSMLCPDDTKPLEKQISIREPHVSESSISGTSTPDGRPSPIEPPAPPKTASPVQKTAELKPAEKVSAGPTASPRTAQSSGDRDRHDGGFGRPGHRPAADQAEAGEGRPTAEAPTEPPPDREPTDGMSSPAVEDEATNWSPSNDPESPSAGFTPNRMDDRTKKLPVGITPTPPPLPDVLSRLPVRGPLVVDPRPTTDTPTTNPRAPLVIEPTEYGFPDRGPLDVEPKTVAGTAAINDHTPITPIRELDMGIGSGLDFGL